MSYREEVSNNERHLYELVPQLKRFTLIQISNKLKQGCPKPLHLKLFWSIERYLEEMRDVGTLRLEGRYYFIPGFSRQKRRRSCC